MRGGAPEAIDPEQRAEASEATDAPDRPVAFSLEQRARSAKVLLDQIGIDRERCLGALGSGDDDPLDVAGGVPGDVESREVGRLVPAGADGALLVDLAAEAERQVRVLRLAGA